MKKFQIILICILFCTKFYANTPNWQMVSGGDPIAPPAKNEYGLTILLDGRTMGAVTAKGHFQWLSTVPGGNPSPFLGKGDGGFIYTVSGNNKLSVFNPSGLCLWTKETPAEIISAPIQGKDGRIFVQCNQQITCFGINGKIKWNIQAQPSAGFPLLQLDDGSILHIQQKTISEHSTAIRISPFGEILEEIIFTGKIVQAKEIDCGILLIFTDGSFGCCSTSDLKAITKWTIPSSLLKLSASSVLVTKKNTSYAAILSPDITNTKITFIDIANGNILSQHTAPINTSLITFSVLENDSVILCDKKTATACSIKEGTIWEYEIPSKKQWSYVSYLDDGYLVVLEKNSWIISAYRVTQKIGSTKSTKKSTPQKNIYKEFTDKAAQKDGISQQSSSIFGRIISPAMLKEIEQKLPQGNFSEKEAVWISALNLETKQIETRFMSQSNEHITGSSIITNSLSYYQNVLFLIGNMESSIFNRSLSTIISNETDNSILIAALQAAANIGYDPENILLDSIQKLSYKSIAHNQRIAQHLCDAVYEICRYMGKPALFTKGRQILSHLLNNTSDARTKAIASITMEKIIALQM